MAIFQQESKLYSIVYLKCPKCHQGDLFKNKNPYRLNTMLTMPARCPVCNQSFQFEAGFYSAALWTSYPLVIVAAAIIVLICYVWLSISGAFLIAIVAVVLLSLQPYFMRIGRSILINNFVDFDQRYKSKK